MKRLDGLKILVVEDEGIIAQAICAAIEADAGIVVGPAADIESARELLQTAAIDGATVDVNLGGAKAHPLIHDLIAHNIPLILTTGYSVEDLIGEWSHLPQLSKPFSEDDLLNCLSQAIKDGRNRPFP